MAVLGLLTGSFVNAYQWRVQEQARENRKKNPDEQYLNRLSIAKGRSLCPNCKHELAAKDLIPLVSWLTTRGKCRYCGKPISIQYPLVELAMAILYVASYVWWPKELQGAEIAVFGLWLVLLIGLMTLLVYDLRTKLLPDRIMRPFAAVASLFALLQIFQSDTPWSALLNLVLAVMVGGGLFYALFQLSKGKWIGGGDVKLGWLLGLVAATPARAFLLIFLAALLGSLASLPLLASKKIKKTSTIPFGPFLIIAAIIVQLFGEYIIDWYIRNFIGV